MGSVSSGKFLFRKSCAVGAAVLVGAIGIGLALLNRFANSDEGIESPSGTPEPIEGAGTKSRPPAKPVQADTGTAGPKSVNASMTKAELYEVATDLGIKGRSSMNKSELLAAIRATS